MNSHDIEKLEKLFKKTTLYIARCDSNNNLTESAPCNNCLNTIISLKIKKIVYSSRDNNIVSINPENLTINHISSGTKFLKNKENEKNNNNSNIEINVCTTPGKYHNPKKSNFNKL